MNPSPKLRKTLLGAICLFNSALRGRSMLLMLQIEEEIVSLSVHDQGERTEAHLVQPISILRHPLHNHRNIFQYDTLIAFMPLDLA